MTPFLLGLILWTLVQYWGHRGWHIMEARKSKTFFAVGEREHHRLWSVMGIGPHNGDHLSPPMWAPLSLIGVITMLIGMISQSLDAMWFGIGITAGFLFDHYVHREMHKRNILKPLAAFHQAHHNNQSGNFGVSLGLGWDVIFRTYLGR